MLCAYWKKYGTEHVIIKLIVSWQCALDENEYVGTVLMDLSKAFDFIPHGLLIAKIKAYGLSNNACEFMASYVKGPIPKGKDFKWKKLLDALLKSIPQRSCFGPFIFNIFMNDLFYFFETYSLTNYADDYTLYMISTTIETVLSALRTDTKHAINWFIYKISCR